MAGLVIDPDRSAGRRRGRPTLVGLMGVVLVIAVWLGWLANSARTQRLALAALRPGCSTRYAHHVDLMRSAGREVFSTDATRIVPWGFSWLHREIGHDYFDDVAAVQVWQPTPAKLKAIGHLSRLRILEFKDPRTPLRDDDLTSLEGLDQLDTLRIWGADLTEHGIIRLSGLTSLEKLDLTFVTLDESSLRSLQRLPHLKTLILGQSSIGGSGLRHLGSLPQVQRLFLDGCDLQDDDLAGLVGMTGLQELYLPSVPIGDAALAHLRRIPSLKSVDLRATHVTKSGVDSLTQAKPTLRVRYP